MAELAGLHSAIKYAVEQQKKTTVCSYSLSGIKVIGKSHQWLYENLSEPTCEIIVLWLPSHIRTDGNEADDKAAKWAVTLHEVTNVPAFPKAISNAFIVLQKTRT